MFLKSPWFWLALVAVAAALYFLFVKSGKSSSIGKPGSFRPAAPAPAHNAFAEDVTAIASLGKAAASIWDAVDG